MSYRFGLSPADVVTDARGNTINTTLSLYVAESDANARTNALTSVPVTQGEWSYTSNTYKSLWARTATSDAFPVISADAQIASLGTSVTVTDNGDGGFTIAGSKVGGWQWAKDTFVTIANAVSLAINPPAPPSPAGTAGTLPIAAREDHGHAINAPHAYPIPTGVDATAALRAAPYGQLTSGQAIANGNVAAPMCTLAVPRPFTLTALSVSVNNAADAGSFKLAIYASDSRGLPTGAPVWTSSARSATSAGRQDFDHLSVALSNPGLYHIVFGSYGFTTTRALPNRGSIFLDPASAAISGNGNAARLTNFNETTGAFPSTPTMTSTNDGTAFWFQFNGDPL